ncbi:MAG: chromosome segregation protein SMC, partial [Wujia sp.]
TDTQTRLLDNGNQFEVTNQRIQDYVNEIVSLKSKREALRNLTERYDGYGNSIKKVMEKKSSDNRIIGVVADIISVDKKYETAIETALGGNIKNIVTEDEETAKRMIGYLKENHLGRATFLPISSIVASGSVNRDALQEQGIVGLASDLVSCDDRYKTIVSHLLGRIYIADHIDSAIRISRKYKQTLRIVTVEGDLITPGGAMTGGSFKNASNLLGRKRELDEIDDLIVKKQTALESDRNKIEELNTARDELKANREAINEKLSNINIRLNTFMLNLDQANAKLEEINSSFARISRENSELDAQVNEINNNKNELANSNKKQEDTVKELEKRIHELEILAADYKNSLGASSENINKLNLEFNTVKQQYDFLLQNVRRVKNDEAIAKENLDIAKKKLGSGYDECIELNNKIEALKNVLEENNRIIAIKEQKLVELAEQKNALNDSHKEFFNKREQLSEQINGLDKSAFKLNASIEKLSEQSENLNNYMWEEYELTYNLASDFKDENFTDISSLKREITAIKSKIKQLGDVNVNAIEDYKQVSERYEFLKGQHDDITKAENNLLNIINELDRAMREQFAEKFKEIRIMFSKVFKELFGGGKADLELVDEQDILETGIKIIAQPPGKKLQNMMQLSGGEKSLTAIALLFAIQSLKPSPFCLLDEIEAALDDSNVKRFAKYLSKLTKDTQFIVITHRKGTMEAADILYGITMQEKGVSTLVSVNMIENELDE